MHLDPNGSSEVNSLMCGVIQGSADLRKRGLPLFEGCLCGVALGDRGAAGCLLAAPFCVGCGAELGG
ncbi:hypothetical protein Rhow_001081 [Rhodococcus wratislaviensis]|uniref:Uncharacterized protein n=1 Tax=Rhodococcus wratislaviensis TaxID=44752 RepID=A0A402CMU7_RHOWR|nr:hypothetical protein Rhow_001081 [Rhodococcus wratislaviensis]